MLIYFYFKTKQKSITFKHLQRMYRRNRVVLDAEANNVQSTDPALNNNLQGLFDDDSMLNNHHTTWRINKMRSARIVRDLFPRPYIISEWSGQSIERYVFLDGPHATTAYSLPNTECSYVFVVQSAGERTIVLKPSSECSNDCRTVSVVLKPSYVCK